MKGATEYYNLISSSSRMRLGDLRRLNRDTAWYMGSDCFIHKNIIFALSDHARGECFHIYIVENVNGTDEEIVNKENCLEVYGVVSGNLGWTECYSWKHNGKWNEYILNYFENLTNEIKLYNKGIEEQQKLKEENNNKIINEKVKKFNQLFSE